MVVFDDLEDYAKTKNDSIALRAIAECKASLNKLIVKMEGLAATFDRIAERSRVYLSSQRVNPALIRAVV